MKSIEELKAIRKKTLERPDEKKERSTVLVGMATCGIAAGARPVLAAFMDEVSKRGLADVMISQTGCIGRCRLEPIVEVYSPGAGKSTYVKVTPQMASEIIDRHILNGEVIKEYTIDSSDD